MCVCVCWVLTHTKENRFSTYFDVGYSRNGFSQEVSLQEVPPRGTLAHSPVAPRLARASARVMEKVGFVYERDFDYAGLTHRFYRLRC